MPDRKFRTDGKSSAWLGSIVAVIKTSEVVNVTWLIVHWLPYH
nr:hypothetical protein JVH1_3097 [Rhodococcus sp. JVH1]